MDIRVIRYCEQLKRETVDMIIIITIFNIIMSDKQTNPINLARSIIIFTLLYFLLLCLLLSFFNPGFYRWGDKGLRDLITTQRPES